MLLPEIPANEGRDAMRRDANIIVIAIVLIAVAAYGGYVFGGMQRQKVMDEQFRLLNFSVGATEVKANVMALELIEAKKYKEAEELLENVLDVRLANLGPYEVLARDHPDKEIFQAVQIARKHREQHPSHKAAPDLEKSVERALSIEETKR